MKMMSNIIKSLIEPITYQVEAKMQLVAIPNKNSFIQEIRKYGLNE